MGEEAAWVNSNPKMFLSNLQPQLTKLTSVTHTDKGQGGRSDGLLNPTPNCTTDLCSLITHTLTPPPPPHHPPSSPTCPIRTYHACSIHPFRQSNEPCSLPPRSTRAINFVINNFTNGLGISRYLRTGFQSDPALFHPGCSLCDAQLVQPSSYIWMLHISRRPAGWGTIAWGLNH